MGVPQARWMVYFMENRDLRWMMTGGYTILWLVYFMENPDWRWMITEGTPILGNLHMDNGKPKENDL